MSANSYFCESWKIQTSMSRIHFFARQNFAKFGNFEFCVLRILISANSGKFKRQFREFSSSRDIFTRIMEIANFNSPILYFSSNVQGGPIFTHVFVSVITFCTRALPARSLFCSKEETLGFCLTPNIAVTLNKIDP
jgi:hypothetical protein